jgi:hypothetical protein
MAHKLLEEKEIFNRARHIAALEERLAYLQETCGHDPAAMHRLLELLRVYEEQRSFLESSPVGHTATIDAPIAKCPGTIIGSYLLLQGDVDEALSLLRFKEPRTPSCSARVS